MIEQITIYQIMILIAEVAGLLLLSVITGAFFVFKTKKEIGTPFFQSSNSNKKQEPVSYVSDLFRDETIDDIEKDMSAASKRIREQSGNKASMSDVLRTVTGKK